MSGSLQSFSLPLAQRHCLRRRLGYDHNRLRPVEVRVEGVRESIAEPAGFAASMRPQGLKAAEHQLHSTRMGAFSLSTPSGGGPPRAGTTDMSIHDESSATRLIRLVTTPTNRC